MQTQDKTLNQLTKEYFSYCKDIAEEAYGMDEDSQREFLEQSIDGCQWIIYTYQARLVAVLTDNVDAYLDVYGETEVVTPEVVAYFAMTADVQQYLTNEYFIAEMQAKEEA